MRQHDDCDYRPFVDWPELAEFGPTTNWVGEPEQLPVEHRLRAAADAGDITSMTLVGWLLRWRSRDEEAAIYLRRAAEAGDVRATLVLAEMVGDVWRVRYDLPVGAGPRREWARPLPYPYAQDWPNGGQALLERAATGDNAEALMILGRQSESARRYPDAVARYRRAADLGLVGAKVRLGRLLARSDTDVTDQEAAGTSLRHAAESGYLPGIVALTEWLATQPGHDDAELERWLRAAAEQLHVDSMFTLAERYAATGRLTEAESFYREALNRATHPFDILETYKALVALLRDQGRTADIAQVREDALLFIDEFLLHPTDEDQLDYFRTIRAEAEGVV